MISNTSIKLNLFKNTEGVKFKDYSESVVFNLHCQNIFVKDVVVFAEKMNILINNQEVVGFF